MRLLYVSNYTSWEKVAKGKMPSQHMFGVHEMVDHYVEYKGNLRGILKDGGYVDFYLFIDIKGIPLIISRIINWIKVYLISFGYDCIYDTINDCTRLFAPMRRWHLLKPKLVSILHHPRFKYEIQFGKADAYIFFDETFKEYAMSLNESLYKRFYVNYWYPEKKWYDKVVSQHISNDEDIFYIDNGRTNRQHNLVEKICMNEEFKCMMPGNGISTKNVIYYELNMKDDLAVTNKILNSKAIIIPVCVTENNGLPLGPYGITSFMDALALNMPVVCSDNCCFAHIVSKNSLGMVFIAGDEKSLRVSMKRLFEDKDFYEECCNNIKKYMRDKDITLYSNKLKDILKEIGLK